MDKEHKKYEENLLTKTAFDNVTLIRFCFNELSLDQREYLKIELNALIRDGKRDFVFDLSRVGFISSLVIALVVFFAKEVRKDNGDVKLCGLSSDGFSIFQLTQLDKVFELYETEHDALESFKKV